MSPLRATTILTITGLLAASPLAQAQDFYKGKTVTITVGFSPGGG